MNLTRDRGILFVNLNGSDLKDPPALHKRFEQLIIHDGERKLLVDLSEVPYMSSMQIGAVVGLHVLAYENLAVIKFAGLHERIKMLFRLLGVDTLLDMHYARAKGALESFGVYEPEGAGEGGESEASPEDGAGPSEAERSK